MEKSLFKQFEKTYLELQIFLEKAKTWGISNKEKKQIENAIKSTTESYQKVKEEYEQTNKQGVKIPHTPTS
jgi:transcriptional/translational regulatory protein YebC/TACO1